jgi:hypothetical protein
MMKNRWLMKGAYNGSGKVLNSRAIRQGQPTDRKEDVQSAGIPINLLLL